jgi:hypothetical protein
VALVEKVASKLNTVYLGAVVLSTFREVTHSQANKAANRCNGGDEAMMQARYCDRFKWQRKTPLSFDTVVANSVDGCAFAPRYEEALSAYTRRSVPALGVTHPASARSGVAFTHPCRATDKLHIGAKADNGNASMGFNSSKRDIFAGESDAVDVLSEHLHTEAGVAVPDNHASWGKRVATNIAAGVASNNFGPGAEVYGSDGLDGVGVDLAEVFEGGGLAGRDGWVD